MATADAQRTTKEEGTHDDCVGRTTSDFVRPAFGEFLPRGTVSDLLATFLVFSTAGRTLTEEALQSGSFAYEDLFSASGLCEGAISISDDIELADELPALVKNLCLEANGELRRSGRATYDFHGWPGQITLARDGAEVTIEGAGVRSARFELEAFTDGLRDCAVRFIGALSEIRCREPARDGERLDLIAFLEAALRASAQTTAS